MNIQLLTPKFLRNDIITRSNQTGLNANNASYPNIRPLANDTVTFSGSEKVLSQRTKDVSFKLANQVAEEFKEPLANLLRVLRNGLKSIVASESHPDNPIMHNSHGIKGRVKSPRSIAEKAISRKLYSQKEIEQLGDVAGARIVMRNTTQKDFDLLFKELGNMVKRGELKITEIENYRLSRKDSYVSSKTLDKFEEVCNKVGLYPARKGQAIPNGYTAVHLTTQAPDGKLMEIQIMGRDMENVKEVEDLYYKYRCKKPLDVKYSPIQKMLDKILPNLTPFQKETLDMYIKDSYINAKQIPPRKSKQKINVIKDFLPLPYSLPKELSYSNLYRMKDECDRIAKKAKH